MSVRKTRSFRVSRSSLSQSLTDDDSYDEDYERRFKSLSCQGSTGHNYELKSSKCRRPINHVAVQTTPEIDEKHYSWLLSMESQANALYVDMSNLVNALLQANNLEYQRRKFNPLSLDFILNRSLGDLKKRIEETELDLPVISTIDSFTVAANLPFTIMLQNMESKLKNILERATEMRNSISRVNTEIVKKTSDKSAQTISPEVKKSKIEKNHFVMNQKNCIRTRIPNQDKKKNDEFCTQKTVTSKLQRSATQLPFVNDKNTNILKKQTSCLNSDWKKRDLTNSKTSSNFAAKKAPLTKNIVTESDMRATGAIPKKTKDPRVKVPETTRKRTDRQVTESSKTKRTDRQVTESSKTKSTDRQVTESSKTKQVSFQKPIWR